LRSDLAFANLKDFLPHPRPKNSLCALDVGCGTGATAVRLAQLGVHVTLLDSSQRMLDLAKRTAQEAEISDKLVLLHGDVGRLTTSVGSGSFDVILCHNILEYVDDPVSALCSVALLLRDSSAVLSILVRNRAGEVFKRAIREGDLDAAENTLDAEWGEESLYGGKVRLFSSENLHAMLKKASLATIAQRGVRVVVDYLPARVSRKSEYQRIFELERKLGSRPEFAGVARYTHCLAQREGTAIENDV
jgi:S-adenosylmethionine-dependent methyltransferase